MLPTLKQLRPYWVQSARCLGVAFVIAVASTVCPASAWAEISSSANPIVTGSYYQVNATAEQLPPDGQPYWVRVYDETHGGQVQCYNKPSCSMGGYGQWWEPDNYAPASTSYRAEIEVVPVGDLPGYTQELGQVTVRQMPYRFPVSLAISATGSDDNRTFEASATTIGDISTPGYALRIYDDAGVQQLYCQGRNSCGPTTLPTGTYHAVVEGGWPNQVYGDSGWYQIGTDGVTPLRSGSVDLYTLAAAFAGPRAICDALLTVPGTHVQGSSLSDQWLACDAAAEAGRSSVGTLLAVSGVAGSSAVIGYVAIQRARQEQGQNPEPPGGDPPPPPPADPPPVTTPPLSPPYFPIEDLVSKLQQRNPAHTLTATQLRTIARNCTARAADAGLDPLDDCSAMPLFVTGRDAAAVADHDLGALRYRPAWAQLNYRVGYTTHTGWYSSDPRCAGSSQTMHCDEYPFQSTVQGWPNTSPGPSLKVVPAAANTLQGGKLGAFYTACGMKAASPPGASGGRPFLHLPLPDQGSASVPTGWLCNSG